MAEGVCWGDRPVASKGGPAVYQGWPAGAVPTGGRTGVADEAFAKRGQRAGRAVIGCQWSVGDAKPSPRQRGGGAPQFGMKNAECRMRQMSPEYKRVKADIRAFVESLRAKMPDAAEYLEQHLVFDDEKETVCYTGDDRLKLERLGGGQG
jgi:hypothetical protein